MMSHPIPASQQIYFSTHNALRVEEIENQKFYVRFYEIRGNRHVQLSIYPFYDVQMIKRLLITKLGLPISTRVNDICLLYRGCYLPNYRVMNTFEKAGKHKLYWCMNEVSTNIGIRELGIKLNNKLEKLVFEIRLAFKRNIAPKLTMDGTGGTYILHNVYRQPIAIFKPSDEEAFAPYNPRGYEGKMNQQGFRAGVLSGEGASREIAAYMLDSIYGNFSGVPATALVEISHPNFNHNNKYVNASKNLDNFVNSNLCSLNSLDSSDKINATKWKAGSLQEFVDAKETCGNYDSRVFSVMAAQRIGVLDIRLMNLDRNDGNILVSPVQSLKNVCSIDRNKIVCMSSKKSQFCDNVCYSPESTSYSFQDCNLHQRYLSEDLLTPDGKQSKYKLIPIDHGLILPDVMDVANIDLVWYSWPQAKLPFTESLLRVIFSFDADKDAERLRKKLFIRDECIRTMRVSTRLLQIGAYMKLNLNQIAEVQCRQDLEKLSALEIIVKSALAQTYLALDCTSLISTNRLGYMIDLADSGATYRCNLLADEKNVNKNQKKSPFIIEDDDEDTDSVDQLVDSLTISAASEESSNESSTSSKKCNSYIVDDNKNRNHSAWIIGENVGNSEEPEHRLDSYCNSAYGVKSEGLEIGRNSETFEVGEKFDSFEICGTSMKHHVRQHKENKKPVDDVCSKFFAKSKYRPHNDHLTVPSALPTSVSAPSKSTAIRSRMTTSGTGSVRISTAYRQRHELTKSSNSTWELQDSRGHFVPLDWTDPAVDQIFFEALEEGLRHYINEKHHQWQSYVFAGDELVKHLQITASWLKGCKRYMQANKESASIGNDGQ